MIRLGKFARWLSDKQAFEKCFTNVNFSTGEDCNYLEGDLKIISESGISYGPFRLRIVFERDYYRGLDGISTYLLSHREQWLNVPDSHIERDWRLCLFIFLESEFDYKEEDTFTFYLERLAAFLVHASNFQDDYKKIGRKAKWQGNERSHGNKGVEEAKRMLRLRSSRELR